MATALEMREIREKSGKVKKCLIVRVESEKFEKNEENQGKSGNLNRLYERKSFTIPWVQSDDLSFYQNPTSRSQGNFSEVRE